MKIEQVHFENIRPASWRTTHLLKPDMKCLVDSLRQGWLAPLVVQESTSVIIDGFSRWYAAQTSKHLLKRDAGMVPVTFVDVDDIDARLMHVRLNRTKGYVIPKYLSGTVRDILISKKYTVEELMKMLHMSADEMALLRDGSLLNHKKIADYEYSKSWVPIESKVGETPVLERPPNSDG